MMETFQKYKLKVNREQMKSLIGFLEAFLRTKSFQDAPSTAISKLIIAMLKRFMVSSFRMELQCKRDCSITLNVWDAAALVFVIRQFDYDSMDPLEKSIVYKINDVIRI